MRQRTFIDTYLKTLEVNFQNFVLRKRQPILNISDDPIFIDVKTNNNILTTISINRWKRYASGIEFRKKRLLEKFHADKGEFADTNIIDVGANIGEFSIAMAEKGAYVFAIEPDPVTIYCLLKNSSRHERIKVFNELLWKEESFVDFYINYQSADGSIISDTPKLMNFKRKTSTLDCLFSSLEIGNVFLLKADCEGAEPELLEGGRDMLKYTKNVAIDTGAERLGQKTHKDCECILRDSGFSVETIFYTNKESVTLGRRY